MPNRKSTNDEAEDEQRNLVRLMIASLEAEKARLVERYDRRIAALEETQGVERAEVKGKAQRAKVAAPAKRRKAPRS